MKISAGLTPFSKSLLPLNNSMNGGSMANDTRLKILMVATEVAPFAKEGGVADVIGSLPKELAALGHEVRIFLPRYGSIDPAYWALKHTGVVRTLFIAGFDRTVSIWQTMLPDSSVTVYLLDNE